MLEKYPKEKISKAHEKFQNYTIVEMSKILDAWKEQSLRQKEGKEIVMEGDDVSLDLLNLLGNYFD